VPSTRPRPASGVGVIRARRDSHRNDCGPLARRREGRGDRVASTARAFHAPAPSLFRLVSLLRPAELVSHTVLNVISIGVVAVGHHRAAWRVHRVVVAAASVPISRGLIRLQGCSGRFAENGRRVSCATDIGLGNGHGVAPLGGSFARHGRFDLGDDRSLIRSAVQHANGADAPDGLCDPVAVARGSFADVGRTGETKNTNHSDKEQIASGCYAHRGRLRHVGIRFPRMGSLGRRCAVGSSSSDGVNSRHEPSVRPRSVSRLLGWSDTAVSVAHAVALSHSGASAAQRRHSRTRSPRPGCSGSAPAFVGGLSVTRVVGLISHGVLKSPASVAASVASPSRRLAADSKRRRLFAPGVSGQDSLGQTGPPVGSRRTAGAFQGSRFGFRHRGRYHAPLRGVRPSSLSRALHEERVHSTNRPTPISPPRVK
jgi:hypothetical protein